MAALTFFINVIETQINLYFEILKFCLANFCHKLKKLIIKCNKKSKTLAAILHFIEGETLILFFRN